MRSSGIRPKKKGLDTIWEDYWEKASEKTSLRCLITRPGVVYHQLHHFLTEATWDAERLNERRLQVMQQCNQTKLKRGFTLIIDDSGQRKSGKETAGVGRQYIGEVGKTDNGVVVVTTHLYDGVKSLPLDVELYQHASSLAGGKADQSFIKKPELALKLVDKSLELG